MRYREYNLFFCAFGHIMHLILIPIVAILSIRFHIDDSDLFKTAAWWEKLLKDECGDRGEVKVLEAECYDTAWQEWFRSGHEFGLRDKEFLDKGLYDILNFLLIYVRKGK